MSFFGGVFLGVFNELLGKPLGEQQVLTAAIVLVVGSFALCFLAAIVIGIAYSKPVRRPRVEDAIEVIDESEYASEDSQSNERRQFTPKREDTRITGEPPPPVVPPDDCNQK
jgi:hypothetical protein